MIYFLYALFILSCIVIVVAVLLQPGKADAGALFTSSVSSTAFGPRGTQTLLAKITIGAAAVFMLTALMLSLPYFTGSRSVLQSVGDVPTPQPTAAPAPPPQTNTVPAAPVQGETGDAANANSDQTNANASASPAAVNKNDASKKPASNQNKK